MENGRVDAGKYIRTCCRETNSFSDVNREHEKFKNCFRCFPADRKSDLSVDITQLMRGMCCAESHGQDSAVFTCDQDIIEGKTKARDDGPRVHEELGTVLRPGNI